jgi:hypothetical protein
MVLVEPDIQHQEIQPTLSNEYTAPAPSPLETALAENVSSALAALLAHAKNVRETGAHYPLQHLTCSTSLIGHPWAH